MTLARGSTSCSCSTVFPVCVGSPARRRAHVCDDNRLGASLASGQQAPGRLT